MFQTVDIALAWIGYALLVILGICVLVFAVILCYGFFGTLNQRRCPRCKKWWAMKIVAEKTVYLELRVQREGWKNVGKYPRQEWEWGTVTKTVNEPHSVPVWHCKYCGYES